MLGALRDRGRLLGAAGLVLGLGLAACSVTQRPSVKVVDPTLREQGTELHRERHKGGFGLGEYEVHDVGVRNEAPDADGPLASEDVRRPVTQHRAGLVLDAPTGRQWTTSCRLQRRASMAADYRAVLDENGDEVAVDCVAKAKGLPPWTFEARALLSRNFVGTLAQEGSDLALQLEVLTRVTIFNRLERLLPVPVVQLRHDEQAVLAVLLGRPERAWVGQGLDPLETEAALALMVTLRYLPWELAE